MAKGKTKSKGYVSKGQRPNISKAQKKMLLREKKKNPEVKDLLKSLHKKQLVMAKPQNNKEKELAKKYQKQYEIEVEASRLFNKYGECGMTWAAAVQAVKTNKIEDLSKKWSKILSEYKKKNSNKSSIMGSALSG